MRARYTSSIGLPVLDEQTGVCLGTIGGILLNPDTGAVEGFFLRMQGFLSRDDIFLRAVDILHWGLRVSVRSADVLTPAEDIIRLQPLLIGSRPVLGQCMLTQSGKVLGRCVDVQFSTKTFRMEWLFPRRWFRTGLPVPVTQIVDVRSDAIVLRDEIISAKEDEEVIPLIPQVPEAA